MQGECFSCGAEDVELVTVRDYGGPIECCVSCAEEPPGAGEDVFERALWAAAGPNPRRTR